LSAPQKAVSLMKGMIKMVKTTKPRTQDEMHYAQLWAEMELPKPLREKEETLL
jgi:hypothetical protein